MRPGRMPFRIAFVCMTLLAGMNPVPVGRAEASCKVDASVDKTGPLMKHLAADCTEAEREANGVDGASVMDAIIQGRAVDLIGVVVRGELSFDRLPVQAVRTPKELTPEQREALGRLNAEEVRSVTLPFTIRDSVVRGAIRHRSERSTLQFEGPVDLHGTSFKQGVDLSRSLFQRSVDLSAARFEQEAYWVQGRFGEAFICTGTKFGPHTRFHRSVFRGAVDCTGALFDGMAEFLETTFEQRALFANARFGLGTGFSGSRFMRQASFADAIFGREAFFTFAVFESESSFSGARFLAAADFSNAEFKRPDDLSKAHFDRSPLFAGMKRIVSEQGAGGESSRGFSYVVTLGLLVAAALLAAYAYKIK